MEGIAANATMAQHLLGQPLILGQSWTLGYELVFYGLVSVLFVAGLHRRSVLMSLVLLAGALVAGNSLAPLALDLSDRIVAVRSSLRSRGGGR